MLRINHTTSAESAKSYYALGDYYGKGGTLVRSWFGRGAALLGLQGQVQAKDFESLCDNQHPQTGEQLAGANRKIKNRKVAYDFTFSAFKSVSLLHALFKDARIEKAFHAAVDSTMKEIEPMMHTRIPVGKSTVNRKTDCLVAAPFTHYLSRPTHGWADPHLHEHMVIFGLTHHGNKWRAGEFRPIKTRGDYYEEIFETHLAQNLQKIGYPVERRVVNGKKKLEIQGVTEQVISKFSRRTQEIEEEIEERNLMGADAKAAVGALTRGKKSAGLKGAKLEAKWKEEAGADYAALKKIYRASLGDTKKPVPNRSAREMVDFAIAHCFERASVFTEHDFITVALKHGTGGVSIKELKAAMLETELIREESRSTCWLTTKTVLAEEDDNIRFVQDTRGTLAPLYRDIPDGVDPRLSTEQRAAVAHILTSMDRVVAIAGMPGSGKTISMKPTIAKIEETGLRVLTFAPSAKASRGVLRKEGFKTADTFQRFLLDPELQETASGQVVWIDEAGLLSSRDMHRLFSLAREKDFRIVLSGDTGQHTPVARGDAMRILEEHAGLRPARVLTVQRQKDPRYLEAVQCISGRKIEEGFHLLQQHGFVRELDGKARYHALADEYVEAVSAGESCLVVAPTHAEGGTVTMAIRERLKDARLLDHSGVEIPTLRNTGWTEALRSRPDSFQPGLVVHLHQNLPGKNFRKGARFTVTSIREGQVWVGVEGGELPLPLERASDFSVFKQESIEVTRGERLRLTMNGKALGGESFNNGDVCSLKGIDPNGDLIMDNGMTLPRNFGHLTHGYYSTSFGSQGDTVDRVLLAQSSSSGRAASAEQFNVSVSRGKYRVSIYTDDAEELLESVLESSARPAAHDVVKKKRRDAILRRCQSRALSLRRNPVKGSRRNDLGSAALATESIPSEPLVPLADTISTETEATPELEIEV